MKMKSKIQNHELLQLSFHKMFADHTTFWFTGKICDSISLLPTHYRMLKSITAVGLDLQISYLFLSSLFFI
jgi:hypothetical protein